MVVFLGRLNKAKLPSDATKAFALIKQEIPEAKMCIISGGYMLKKFEKEKVIDITVYGKVKNKLKHKLSSRSHLVLVLAIQEGSNLAVMESNAMGTPVVVYDVPALRD